MPTITIDLPAEAGETGMTLELIAAGVLLNAGGDTLTESANGYFSATVAESPAAGVDYRADVKDSGGDVFYSDTLHAGETHVGKSNVIKSGEAFTASGGGDDDKIVTFTRN